jgi:hypothetical protein
MELSVVMVIYGLILVALGVLLIQRYVATRNVGFLILAIALVAWPVLMMPLDLYIKAQLDASATGGDVRYPFTLITEGRRTAGTVVATVGYVRESARLLLALLGFAMLVRSSSSHMGEEAAPTGSVAS